MDRGTQAVEAGGAHGEEPPDRPPSRRRALWTIVGVAGGLLALGVLFSVLQATVRSDAADTFPVDAAEGVDVSVPRGDIRITAEGDARTLLADSSYFLRSPSLDLTEDAGVTRLRGECGWPSSCDIDVTGRVPAGTDVTLRAERGDLVVDGRPGVVDVRSERGAVRVEGPARDVQIASGSGEVTVIGALGAVRAEAVAGDIGLTGLSGSIRARGGEGVVLGEALRSAEVEVEGGAGGVRLRFAEAPDRVEVDVGEGPAEIIVPAGRYRLDTDVNQGDLVVEGIIEDPDATRRIRVRTIQGDATVEGVPG